MREISPKELDTQRKSLLLFICGFVVVVIKLFTVGLLEAAYVSEAMIYFGFLFPFIFYTARGNAFGFWLGVLATVIVYLCLELTGSGFMDSNPEWGYKASTEVGLFGAYVIYKIWEFHCARKYKNT